MNEAACPWCEAPRVTGPSCPRCGADYAKAAAIRKHGRAAPVAAAERNEPAGSEAQIFIDASSELEDSPVIDDAQTEFWMCVAAIPALLLLGLAFHQLEWGRWLQRLLFTMPVHELGHAVTAWLCGFGAIPTVWITHVMEERGFVAPLAVFAAIVWALYRGWQNDDRRLLLAGAIMLPLQGICTLALSEDTARALIVFGGDGMGMVLAILLMGSFFIGRDTQLYKGSLRWGFATIGAAAFIDISATWWLARRDRSEIPFMTRDNGMESDALRLVNEFGWTEAALVNRHVLASVVCLAALVAVYGWGVRRAWFRSESSTAR